MLFRPELAMLEGSLTRFEWDFLTSELRSPIRRQMSQEARALFLLFPERRRYSTTSFIDSGFFLLGG